MFWEHLCQGVMWVEEEEAEGDKPRRREFLIYIKMYKGRSQDYERDWRIWQLGIAAKHF